MVTAQAMPSLVPPQASGSSNASVKAESPQRLFFVSKNSLTLYLDCSIIYKNKFKICNAQLSLLWKICHYTIDDTAKLSKLLDIKLLYRFFQLKQKVPNGYFLFPKNP